MEFRTQRVVRRVVAMVLVTFALIEGVWSAAQTQITTRTAAASRSVFLKEGTEVKLRLRDRLTSRTAADGDPVNLILDQYLKIGDVTVAKAGSVAVGTISHGWHAGQTW